MVLETMTVSDYCEYVVNEISRWKAINEYGCSDPFWADGCNMNLTRNHIIFSKREIMRMCEEAEKPLPEKYFLPTPPKVEENYMAVVDGSDRVKRIRKFEGRLVTKSENYDDNQMSFYGGAK